MSKTSVRERQKAVRLAWEREQKLVSEGKGTRDWTQEQQEDILNPDKGKAHDENGRAFEGQHMKSVAEYPEYRDNPDNIQFLTREEHLAAHKGNWQNPTNWYYNPRTKEFVDFGENAPTPCEIINLSKPVEHRAFTEQEDSYGLKDLPETEDKSIDQRRFSKQESSSHNSKGTSYRSTVPPSSLKNKKTFGDKVLHAIAVVMDFSEKHPNITKIIKLGGTAAIAVGAAVVSNINSGGNKELENGNSAFSSSDVSEDNDSLYDEDESLDYVENCESGTPKRPHLRNAYLGHRWKKNDNGELELQETWVRKTYIHKDQLNE